MSTIVEQVPRIMEGVVTLSKDRDLKTYNESNSLLHSICDFQFVYGLMVLKLILSNTDDLSRYLQGEQMDVITAKKTADAVVKTLSNCRNEESFTQMWSHADVIGQKIRIGIKSTKFAFRDAKVPRTRPSCRLQDLTGKTPAAANDSSQQTAKEHFRITGYYTSIDKVVTVNFNQGLRAMTRRFCAHWAKSYSAVLQASTTSKLYQISMAWIVKCYKVRSQSLKTTTAGTHAREKTHP